MWHLLCIAGHVVYPAAMDALVLYDHKASICSQMARLALVEKGLSFTRQQIDIMEENEQFSPWYVALNPRAVVPTLKIGDQVITDTIRIVNRVQTLPGVDLSGDTTTQKWLKNIMALHYGVLLYRNRLDADGTAKQIVARARFLAELRNDRPDLRPLVDTRIAGNIRFQALLKDKDGIDDHVNSARRLVDQMIAAVEPQDFLAGAQYSLADCFATAALARFTIHNFAPWWQGTALEGYYHRMKARPSFTAAEVIDTGTERDL
jgi:glutathione S-transferase